MLFSQIVLLASQVLLTHSSTSNPDQFCGSLRIQPCKVKAYRRELEGFSCDTSLGTVCLERSAWCHIGFWYVNNERCNDSANLMFSNCLSLDKTINDHSYHVSLVSSDWTVAEQYCQSKGFHLVDFANQNEFDDILRFLQSIRKKPEKLLYRSDLRVSDPLAQRCWPDLLQYADYYWTGLFFDRRSQLWKYTSGAPVNRNVASGSTTLNQTILQYLPDTHSGFISFVDQNYTFHLNERRGSRQTVDAMNGRAKIICKKPATFAKWNGGLEIRNEGCISGFKCGDSSNKCITGQSFSDSDVCNDTPDCARNDDESPTYCSAFKARFPDKHRLAYFYPYKRSRLWVKQHCAKLNLSMPTIHGPQDVEFFRQLPKMFAESQKANDFVLLSHDWENLQFNVLLGIQGGAEVWEDGSIIDHNYDDLAKMPGGVDVYLVFNKTSKGTFAGFYDTEKTVFPVCQGKEEYTVVVPIPVLIKSAGTKHAVSFAILFVLLAVARSYS